MTRPWRLVDAADTAEGRLELHQRGERDFVITVDGRVLMNGAASRSEEALARAACAGLAGAARPRVLLGGLGMGRTLRAALDALPAGARLVVAEIDPTIVAWCRGPLAPLHGQALDDRRVRVEIADVAAVIAAAGAAAPEAPADPRFDAIVLDLYEGPRGAAQAADPLYGSAALERTRRALAPGGVLAVWSEEPDAPFERRLAAAGFRAERQRPGGGGPRHAVYLARAGRRESRRPA
jgi:spermidine synthase